MAGGAFERRAGGGEVSAPQLDLAELVPRLADVIDVIAFERDHRRAQL